MAVQPININSALSGLGQHQAMKLEQRRIQDQKNAISKAKRRAKRAKRASMKSSMWTAAAEIVSMGVGAYSSAGAGAPAAGSGGSYVPGGAMGQTQIGAAGSVPSYAGAAQGIGYQQYFNQNFGTGRGQGQGGGGGGGSSVFNDSSVPQGFVGNLKAVGGSTMDQLMGNPQRGTRTKYPKPFMDPSVATNVFSRGPADSVGQTRLDSTSSTTAGRNANRFGGFNDGPASEDVPDQLDELGPAFGAERSPDVVSNNPDLSSLEQPAQEQFQEGAPQARVRGGDFGEWIAAGRDINEPWEFNEDYVLSRRDDDGVTRVDVSGNPDGGGFAISPQTISVIAQTIGGIGSAAALGAAGGEALIFGLRKGAIDYTRWQQKFASLAEKKKGTAANIAMARAHLDSFEADVKAYMGSEGITKPEMQKAKAALKRIDNMYYNENLLARKPEEAGKMVTDWSTKFKVKEPKEAGAAMQIVDSSGNQMTTGSLAALKKELKASPSKYGKGSSIRPMSFTPPERKIDKVERGHSFLHTNADGEKTQVSNLTAKEAADMNREAGGTGLVLPTNKVPAGYRDAVTDTTPDVDTTKMKMDARAILAKDNGYDSKAPGGIQISFNPNAPMSTKRWTGMRLMKDGEEVYDPREKEMITWEVYKQIVDDNLNLPGISDKKFRQLSEIQRQTQGRIDAIKTQLEVPRENDIVYEGLLKQANSQSEWNDVVTGIKQKDSYVSGSDYRRREINRIIKRVMDRKNEQIKIRNKRARASNSKTGFLGEKTPIEELFRAL